LERTKAFLIRGFFKLWVKTGAYTRWRNGTDSRFARMFTNRNIKKMFLPLVLSVLIVVALFEGLVGRIFMIFRSTQKPNLEKSEGLSAARFVDGLDRDELERLEETEGVVVIRSFNDSV